MSHAKGRSLPGPRAAGKSGAAFSPSYRYMISSTYFSYPMLSAEPRGTAVGIGPCTRELSEQTFPCGKTFMPASAQRSNQNSVIHCIAIQPRQEANSLHPDSGVRYAAPDLAGSHRSHKPQLSFRQRVADSEERGRDRTPEQPHRPEFYVPRLTRRLANLMFGAYSS